jgi:hypothetical protein
LWAFAILFDTAWGAHLATFSARTPVVLAAIWTLFRPSSLPRFLLLITLQTVVAFLGQPDPGDHWFFMIVVHLTIFLALLLRPAAPPTLERLYGRVGPAVRAEVVVLYAFAALSKLNSSFLDPEVSCAALFYGQLATNVPVFPEAGWAVQTAIFSTIAIEATIPVLLAFRRTRAAGVLLAVAFHLLLAAGGAPSFSVAAFALLTLFLPPAVFRAAVACFTNMLRYIPLHLTALVQQPVSIAVILGLAIGPAVATQLGWLPAEAAAWWTSRTMWALWLVGGSFLGGILLFGFATSDTWRLATPAAPAMLPVLLWIGPALALANGLSPYAGGKTENTFTMFSNLRTEGEHGNHLLIPRSVRVLGLQNDLVRVIGSSEPVLRSFAEPGTFLVSIHFRELASRLPQAWVTYESGGQIQHVSRIADVPLLSTPPGPPLLRKLLVFRPVDIRGDCQH